MMTGMLRLLLAVLRLLSMRCKGLRIQSDWGLPRTYMDSLSLRLKRTFLEEFSTFIRIYDCGLVGGRVLMEEASMNLGLLDP